MAENFSKRVRVFLKSGNGAIINFNHILIATMNHLRETLSITAASSIFQVHLKRSRRQALAFGALIG